MPCSRDTLLDLSMTLTRLSGAKSLCNPLVSQLLDEWVASSPLAKARWYEATDVAQLRLICNKQIEAVKQQAPVLFPVPELIGLLMDLNVAKGGFRHVSEFMTCRGATYTAATGHPFPRPGHMEAVGEAACLCAECKSQALCVRVPSATQCRRVQFPSRLLHIEPGP